MYKVQVGIFFGVGVEIVVCSSKNVGGDAGWLMAQSIGPHKYQISKVYYVFTAVVVCVFCYDDLYINCLNYTMVSSQNQSLKLVAKPQI